MRRGYGRILAEGAGGIKSGAGGWGEALAGENVRLRMPVNGSVTGFEIFSRYLYQCFIKLAEGIAIIFDFIALYFTQKYGKIL